MPKQDITCDNCGSMFHLAFDEGEVSYNASHCPFCGDFFASEDIELDFDKDEPEYFVNEDGEDELDFDDDN
jgi:hypothetical protein